MCFCVVRFEMLFISNKHKVSTYLLNRYKRMFEIRLSTIVILMRTVSIPSEASSVNVNVGSEEMEKSVKVSRPSVI